MPEVGYEQEVAGGQQLDVVAQSMVDAALIGE
jgi:hypothetical protein